MMDGRVEPGHDECVRVGKAFIHNPAISRRIAPEVCQENFPPSCIKKRGVSAAF
jgi:hypothetical protein